MKIKTPFFVIEFEILFVIVFLVFVFSVEIRKLLFSFFICYLFIIFHELSHMCVAAIFGKEIASFKFTVSGVCIAFKQEKYTLGRHQKTSDCIKDLLIYLAGPCANLILAFLFQKHAMIFQVNLCFAIINLFPIQPLDGYHILNNILSLFKTSEKLKQIILTMVSYISIFLIFILAVFQLIESLNIAVFIFFTYICMLKIKSNQMTKNDRIYHPVGC